MFQRGTMLDALGIKRKQSSNARQVKRSKNNRQFVFIHQTVKETVGPEAETEIADWSPNDEVEGWEMDEQLDLVDPDCEISPLAAKARRYISSDDPMREWMPHREMYLKEMLRLEGQTNGGRRGICMTCCQNATTDGEDRGEEPTPAPMYRCQDCFWGGNECEGCCLKRHRTLPLHRVERWTGKCFERTTLQQMGLRVQLGHQGGSCPVPDAGPKVFTILHVNGLHTVSIDYCNCSSRIPRHYQLLRERWYPATVKLPATCATFEVLRHFHGLSLCSKISAHEYYLNLERLTNNSRIDVPKTRYRAFLRMIRQFRHLKMLARAGRGHVKDGIATTKEGELALECVACPMEGVNLPEGWEKNTPLALMFLYTLFVSIDANFRLKNRLRNSEAADPGLHTGLAYFVPSQPYNAHIMKHATQADISNCSTFGAISRADSKLTAGLRFTGVAMCVCSRHEMIRRSGVGDLQKGERYCNMDFILLSALCGILFGRIMIIYDIACQWKINFQTRMAALLPEKLRIPPSTAIDFAIPKCHAPAHQQSCQAPHSLNLKPGVGRTDGEGIERDWSMLNAAASSTREMGLGSRHDTLDDLFAYHNWQKTTGLGISLKRKYLLASVEARRHKGLHADFCDSVPGGIQATWTKLIVDWESDKSKPNPYEAVVDYEMEADIKRRLLLHEIKDNTGVGGDEETNETSWLTTGLMIEETQRRLKLEGTPDALTSLQGSQLQEKRLLLQRQIKTFRRHQAFHMRLPSSLLPDTTLHSEPESVSLCLPSSLTTTIQSRYCSASLIEKEVQLRTGQCNDALERIRLTHRAKRQAVIYKKKNVTGQRAGTHAHDGFQRLDLKIKQSALKYRAARTALVGLLGTAAMPPHLRELRDSDITPPPAFDIAPPPPTNMQQVARQLGEGTREVSWIWRVPGVYHESDVSLNAGLRIEWAKSRARSLRWNEELLLVKEEMRRVRETLQYRAGRWKERADYTPTDDSSGTIHLPATDTTFLQGLRAYAHKQQLVNERLRSNFTALWEKPPTKRSHFATMNIQPLDTQDLVTAADETLMSELLSVARGGGDSLGSDDDDNDDDDDD